jgi:excisionase family DNA binding protein
MKASPNYVAEENARTVKNAALAEPASAERRTSAHAATPQAATAGREDNNLLTIQQVAEILHVPVSWVYGRTRKRSTERLPGIRLGKYWRFREEEIHAWVEKRRGGHRVP